MSEEVKRGPGRPRKEQPFAPATDAGEFDLDAVVMVALKKNFPGAEYSLKRLDEADDKLSFRRLMDQLRVRVVLPNMAMATLIPVDADQAEVDAAMTRLRTDRRETERHLSKYQPDGTAPAGTRD